METKHTPGPWRWAQGAASLNGREWSIGPGVLIAAYTDGTPGGDAKDKANARLMQLAPEFHVFAQEIAIGAYTPEEATARARELLRKCCDV
jgi:hypothetical protein